MIGGERVGAILAAAGTGTRAGAPKQWLRLGGQTVLARSAATLASCGVVDQIVAVVPPGDEVRGREALSGLPMPVEVVTGGPIRADSVRNGLRALENCAIVLVHDAARPFATPALARAVATVAARDGAALAAVPSIDTIKEVSLPAGFDLAKSKGALDSGETGVVLPTVARTVDRRNVWMAQTPQGFRVELLWRAFEMAAEKVEEATDECVLVERLGLPVSLVPGEQGNFKLTTPDDIARARARLEAPVAVGVGYDVHPFAAGRRLVLGGVEFEGDGLLGHSDADVCAHAIGDAILGAAGLGDLGHHFPDTDDRWKGISSLVLLREIVGKAAAAGWRVANCDVTLAARRPKIAPAAAEMSARLAEALGVEPGQVNVKATTGEKLGFVGRGEGIAAHAVALLARG